MKPGTVDQFWRDPRFSFPVAVLVGMLVALGTVTWWAEANSELAFHVLGGGNRVSVLVVDNNRRVLIASGTNGAEFSNALDEALPPFPGGLDVILIDPDASPDVIERARALNAALTLQLPGAGSPGSNTLSQTMTIPLSNGSSFRVEVGSAGNWLATIGTSSGVVAIGTGGGQLPIGTNLFVDLDAGEADSILTIGPPGMGTAAGVETVAVPAGERASIFVEDDQLRVKRP